MRQMGCEAAIVSSKGKERLTGLEDAFTRDGLAFGTEADTSVSGAVGEFENHLGAVLLTKRRASGGRINGSLAIDGRGDLACSQRRGGHVEKKSKERGRSERKRRLGFIGKRNDSRVRNRKVEKLEEKKVMNLEQQ